MQKIIKARELVRPAQRASRKHGPRSESRTVQIVLSGQWLEALGFKASQPVYVGIVGDTVTLTATPPTPAQLTPLQTIKAEFESLGIPTTR